jgi:hypothetical protein
MNAPERAILDRMDAVLRECGTLRPPNPAHTAAIFAHSPVLTECARDLSAVIGYLRIKDYADANTRLDDVDARLAAHRERVIPEPR